MSVLQTKKQPTGRLSNAPEYTQRSVTNAGLKLRLTSSKVLVADHHVELCLPRKEKNNPVEQQAKDTDKLFMEKETELTTKMKICSTLLIREMSFKT